MGQIGWRIAANTAVIPSDLSTVALAKVEVEGSTLLEE